MLEYQVLVFGEDDEIVSSQHFDKEPTEQILDELLSDGVRIECHLVEGDEYSKFLFSYENIF